MTTQTRLRSALSCWSHRHALAGTLASALLILLAGSWPAAAQSGSGVAVVEGSVTDPDNRAVPNALVLIISSETGYTRTLSTDARGRYFASAIRDSS